MPEVSLLSHTGPTGAHYFVIHCGAGEVVFSFIKRICKQKHLNAKSKVYRVYMRMLQHAGINHCKMYGYRWQCGCNEKRLLLLTNFSCKDRVRVQIPALYLKHSPASTTIFSTWLVLAESNKSAVNLLLRNSVVYVTHQY